MLQGQTVIVTGSGMGIGRFIAHTFARERANLVLADVDTRGLDNVTNEIRGLGAEVLPVRTDVRNEYDVRTMVKQAADRFGRVDVLVNNAGIVPHFQWGGPRWAKIRDLDKDFWEKVLGTNLGGTFLCTKHVLPYMENQRSGHILNLYGGGRGDGSSPYVISKEAIRYFTRYVAEEERALNICIAVLSPGAAIATENAPEEARQRMPGPELVANRFVLAAEAGMDMSGELLDLKDGKLVVALA